VAADATAFVILSVAKSKDLLFFVLPWVLEGKQVL
jgi:hypothetical protein